jgi:XTP/dITP diphosphohydrolase
LNRQGAKNAKTEIVIATSNRGKFLELQDGLKDLNILLQSLHEFPDVPEAPELGTSFEEIAVNKARFYYERLQFPVLAEDSGLVIPSMEGFPGIFSARIAPTDSERIQVILSKLQGKSERSAFYYCSMVFLDSKGMMESQGRCDGHIIETPRGSLGFGYDPIFCPEKAGRTFGEMNLQEKAYYSHRGRALRQLLPQLKNWIPDNP